jgi:hypothetical protein
VDVFIAALRVTGIGGSGAGVFPLLMLARVLLRRMLQSDSGSPFDMLLVQRYAEDMCEVAMSRKPLYVTWQ